MTATEEQPRDIGAAAPAAVLDLDGRIPALDGLRGLAAALVMFLHFTITSEVSDPLLDVYYSIAHLGWSGVDLFFVLSGFLITGILVRNAGRPGYYRNFYMRRVLRIFPLYFAFLLVVLVGLRAFGGLGQYNWFWLGEPRWGDQWWYWLYLSNVYQTIHGDFQHLFLNVTWSLAIEEHFYLAWPFLVAALARRHLAWACGAIVVLCPLLRVGALALGIDDHAVYVLTPFRLDGLALGGLLAIGMRDAAWRARLGRFALPVMLGAGGVIATSTAVARIVFDVPPPFLLMHPLFQTAGYTAFTLLYGGLLVTCLVVGPGNLVHGFFTSKAMRFLGKYSYALYLFNMPARFIVELTVLDPNTFADLDSRLMAQAAFYPMATTVCIAMAMTSWYVLEQPFLRLKKRFE